MYGIKIQDLLIEAKKDSIKCLKLPEIFAKGIFVLSKN